MEIPIRCFTCNKVLSDKWLAYKNMIDEQKKLPKEVLDYLGLTKPCCRRHMITTVDFSDKFK